MLHLFLVVFSAKSQILQFCALRKICPVSTGQNALFVRRAYERAPRSQVRKNAVFSRFSHLAVGGAFVKTTKKLRKNAKTAKNHQKTWFFQRR